MPLRYKLCCLSVIALLSASAFFIRLCDYHIQHHSVDQPLLFHKAVDWLETGSLYTRTDTPETAFKPAAQVYKFPPFFQFTVIPWTWMGADISVYMIGTRIIMTALYLLSGLIVIRFLMVVFLGYKLKGNPRDFVLLKEQALSGLFCWLSVIWLFLFGPFLINYGLFPDLYVGICVFLAAWLLISAPFYSGFLLAIASMLKVYPIYLALVFLWTRQWKGLLGVAIGLLVCLLLSIFIIGPAENWYYFFTVLPVLMEEGPAVHPFNLSLEYFAYKLRLVDEVSQHYYKVQKFLTASLLLSIALTAPATNNRDKAICFAWVTSGTLLFLTSYWSQYQIILLFPLLVLLAISFDLKHHGLLLESRITAILCTLLGLISIQTGTLIAGYGEELIQSSPAFIEQAHEVGLYVAIWSSKPWLIIPMFLSDAQALLPWCLYIYFFYYWFFIRSKLNKAYDRRTSS